MLVLFYSVLYPGCSLLSISGGGWILGSWSSYMVRGSCFKVKS